MEQSFGKKAVGLAFNPSGNQLVTNTKLAYAEAIDNILVKLDANRDNPTVVAICEKAIQETITAQMWAVKAITWSD